MRVKDSYNYSMVPVSQLHDAKPSLIIFLQLHDVTEVISVSNLGKGDVNLHQ